ncbi:MAG: hypothetical protein NTY66_01980 [Candidatus Vogelbacteria bacterium]|nr:hypothetical protein [Candidatus Vogelbacteria bacterium]
MFPIAYGAEIVELAKIKANILRPFVLLLFLLAIVYFFWGVVKFIRDYGEKGATEEGKKHLWWGLVGLVIMVSVFGLLNLLITTINSIR